MTQRLFFLAMLLTLACGASPSPTAGPTAAPSDSQTGPETQAAQSGQAHAVPDHVDPAEVVVTEVGDVVIHTFVSPELGAGVTSHVIETESHLVVVDTLLFVDNSAQLRAFCDSLGKPIERVIVTHGHPDHYFGLAQFEDIERAAFPAVVNQIERRHEGHLSMHRSREGDLVPSEVVMPNVELEEGAFTVDGTEIVVERVMAAEDVEQALIWLPTQRVLIAQDLTSNGYHAFFGTGPTGAWQSLLTELVARQPEVVLSGHGGPGGARVLTAMRTYLERAEEAKENLTSRGDLIAEMEAAYPDLRGRFLLEVSELIVLRDRRRAANANE